MKHIALISVVLVLLAVVVAGGSAVRAEDSVQYEAGARISIRLDDGDWVSGMVGYEIDGNSFPYGMKDPAEGSSQVQILIDTEFQAVEIQVNGETVYEGAPVTINPYQGIMFR